jgi:FMN-dependent NADH-azoreductase
MTLYLNCCVRSESRTNRLAKAFLNQTSYTELYLPSENIQPLTEETLQKRNMLLATGQYDEPMLRYARQFAEAERIVIAAPFWDGSFPSILKVYIENIYAIGIVTSYGDKGQPVGLCKANELIYITTAGGQYIPDFSYHYIETLSKRIFGIPKTRLIKAEMLDIVGMDAEQILSDAIKEM